MNRSFLVLIGITLLLVLVALLVANPFKDRIRTKPSSEELFDGASIEGADRIEILGSGAAPVVLDQGREGWVVASQGNFRADTSAVGSILRAVAGASSRNIVSSNPGNQSKFQVDSTGVQVRVSAGGDQKASFFIGKAGTDFTTSYVRMDGSEDVHVVRGINKNLFTRTQGFRDRTLIKFDTADLSIVEVKSGDIAWMLTQEDSAAWSVAVPGSQPVPAKQETVDPIVRTLSSLNSDGFQETFPDTLKMGLETPFAEIAVTLKSGDKTVLTVGEKNEKNQRFLKSSKENAVYLLGDWRVTAVVKKYDELVPEPVAGERP